MKEFNLSDKIWYNQGEPKEIQFEDVKEFIKILKEEIEENSGSWKFIIDKLAGDKLI